MKLLDILFGHQVELNAQSVKFMGEYDRKVGKLQDDISEHGGDLSELRTATKELMEAELRSIKRAKKAFKEKAAMAIRRLEAFRNSAVARLQTCREETRAEELDVALDELGVLVQEIRDDLLPQETRLAISAAVETRVKAARESIAQSLQASRKLRGAADPEEEAESGEGRLSVVAA